MEDMTMKYIKINNKKYEVPELTFAHSKKLEIYGVPLRRLVDPDLIFTIASAFVAIIIDKTPYEADYLIEQHILGGGDIQDIYKAYFEAISESHFFKKLLENQEKNQTMMETVDVESNE
jgi:hypothetical protein